MLLLSTSDRGFTTKYSHCSWQTQTYQAVLIFLLQKQKGSTSLSTTLWASYFEEAKKTDPEFTSLYFYQSLIYVVGRIINEF